MERDLDLDQGHQAGGLWLALPPLIVIVLASLAVTAVVPTPSAATPAILENNAADSLSKVFTPEVQFWGGPIRRWAATAGLDPNLVAVVMQIESCGDPFARSHAGAMGLFQVMPYHFAPSDDPYAPDDNALRGLAYLKRSFVSAEGNVQLGLAGYNGGIGVISRPDWLWPAETQRYAYWGATIYRDAVSGAAASERLDEWLAAGGRSLCSAAAQRLGLVRNSG
jgi:soluble lytic murein transglycosylase-like protein